MSYEIKPNTGSLFLEPKEKEGKYGKYDSYSGKIKVQCPMCNKEHEFWLNGIGRQTKNGFKVADLKLKLIEEKPVNLDRMNF